jgi:hypothetical protein
VVAAWAIGAGLSASRAAAARHHFQTLDFLAHGFVKYAVGQEDQPVRAGVGVVVLTADCIVIDPLRREPSAFSHQPLTILLAEC